MKCPNDNTTLVISDRQNIEIDYCPECRGVWLDRGELDKLIERSAVVVPPAPTQPVQHGGEHHQSYDYSLRGYDGQRNQHYSHHPHHKKRKESFLGDIFDF